MQNNRSRCRWLMALVIALSVGISAAAAGVTSNGGVSGSIDPTTFKTVVNHDNIAVPMDLFRLVAQQSEMESLSPETTAEEVNKHFDDRHVDKLIHAMSVTKDPHVLITERNDPSRSWSLQDFEESLAANNGIEGTYDTVYSYSLSSKAMDAVILDNHPRLVEDFVGITTHSLHHCPSASHSNSALSQGQYVLASKKVFNRLPTHHPMKSYFSRKNGLNKKSTGSSAASSVTQEGWATLRRIVSVQAQASNGECYLYQTEAVHPLEIFEGMRVESLIRHPMDVNYMSYSMTPDSPITSCDSNEFGYNFYSNGEFAANYAITSGCVSYSKSLPGSFNFNYDSSKKGASKESISIITGVTCNDCYIYAGAALLVIFEYVPYTMRFQAKIGGGAGFNADIYIQNPSLSSSQVVQLLGASASSSLYLGTIKLNFNFQSLKATISGTISGSGEAAFGAGVSADASMSIKYADSTFSAPYSFDSSYNPPYFNISEGFSVTAVANLMITAQEKFTVSYGSLVDLGFNVDFTTDLEFSLGSVTLTSFTVDEVPKLPSTLVERRLRGVSDGETIVTPPSVYVPGDIIPISITYAGVKPNDKFMVFFSLVHVSPEGLPVSSPLSINNREFNASTMGEGEILLDWMLPWDASFASQDQSSSKDNILKLVIHTSYAMREKNFVYSSRSFVIEMFTEQDTIFSRPQQGEIVSLNEVYELSWNHSLLNYFEEEMGTGGHGAVKNCEEVRLILVAEKEEATEATTVAATPMMITLFPISEEDVTDKDKSVIKNIGIASVLFNETALTSQFQTPLTADLHYYVVVQCASKQSVKGWSSGYFSLSASKSAMRSTVATKGGSLSTLDTMKKNRLSLFGSSRADIVTSANPYLLSAALSSGVSGESSIVFADSLQGKHRHALGKKSVRNHKNIVKNAKKAKGTSHTSLHLSTASTCDYDTQAAMTLEPQLAGTLTTVTFLSFYQVGVGSTVTQSLGSDSSCVDIASTSVAYYDDYADDDNSGGSTTTTTRVPTVAPTLAPATATSKSPTRLPTVAPSLVSTTKGPTRAPTTSSTAAAGDDDTAATDDTTTDDTASNDDDGADDDNIVILVPTVSPTRVPTLLPSKLPTFIPTVLPSNGYSDRDIVISVDWEINLSGVSVSNFKSSVDDFIAMLYDYLSLPTEVTDDNIGYIEAKSIKQVQVEDDDNGSTLSSKSEKDDGGLTMKNIHLKSDNKKKNAHHHITKKITLTQKDFDKKAMKKSSIAVAASDVATQTSNYVSATFLVQYGTNSNHDASDQLEIFAYKMDYESLLLNAIQDNLDSGIFGNVAIESLDYSDPEVEGEGNDDLTDDDDAALAGIIIISTGTLAGIIIAMLIAGILIGILMLYCWIHRASYCSGGDSGPNTNKIYVMESAPLPPPQQQVH